ncbi:DNase I-like protein [Auriscalpium vulgare]|uniref:DNase I-like protein n=1 Tax=Auriscalpium vulgare TaxID=40419 RepID=A0ACB8S0U5_9AGAM|nr:DNase I-like protein [Auriscalpium vulgare]
MADQNDVRLLLRPSEFVRVVLEGTAARAEPDLQVETPKGNPEQYSWSGREYSAVLAIVGHLDNATGEAGAAFIYQVETSPLSSQPLLALQRVLPIQGDFSIGVSQVNPPVFMSGETDVSSVTSQPTDPGFSLELSDGSSEPITLVTHDKEHLSSVLLACRRLRDLASQVSTETVTYPWLAPYALHPSSWFSVTPPRDLRHSAAFLHERLSPACAGEPGDDVADFNTIRDEWLYTKARSTVEKDAEQKSLRIRVGTFNANGKLPTQDLATWIGATRGEQEVWEQLIPPLKEISPLSLGEVGNKDLDSGATTPQPVLSPIKVSDSSTEELAHDPDLFVLAFQELDLSTEALLYSTKTTREDAWTAATLAALGEKGEHYEKLISKQLVGMLLIVIVRKELRKCFLGARTAAVGAGLMGIMGNKGAVAVRLTYRPAATPTAPSPTPTTLTFVNSHLAALDEMLERRNGDFRDISRRLEFGPCAEYMWGESSDETGIAPPMATIYASDVLVEVSGHMFVGLLIEAKDADLNYRVNLPDPDVRYFLSHNFAGHGVHTLLKFDQLKGSMRNAKAFVGFSEHPITHLPTYRFNTGLLTDSLGYDNKRKPAWTDRILHMSSPFTPARQLSYTSHPEISFSDHRPISADFVVETPTVDSMALESTANELYKAILGVDPEDLPSPPLLKLDETALDFGKVLYERPAMRTLHLKNIGKVPAAFRFYPREIDSPIHPDWLEISPLTGFLLPGEAMPLTFRVLVTRTSAARLNLHQVKLSVLLILHTALGQDLFISASGKYESTCFGNSLATLTRLPGPIRELKGEEDLIPEAQSRNSSREAMKLVNWLMSNDVATVDDLFFARGDEELVAQIRECLDTGTDFPAPPKPPPHHTIDPSYARAVATTLVDFLDSLPEPVIPVALHVRCAGIASRDAAYEMLSLFPPASVNLWIAVTAFLHLLVLQNVMTEVPLDKKEELDQATVTPVVSEKSSLPEAEKLAAIFAPLLLRDDIEAPAPVSLLEKRRFLLYFMEG